MTPPDRDSLLALGKLGAPHGLRGEFRFIPYCDSRASALDLVDPEAAGENPLVWLGFRDRPGEELLEARVDSFRGGAPGKLLIAFESVPDRDAADAFPRYEVFVAEDALRGTLEEDSYLLEDLVGCEAFDPQGRPVGRVGHAEEGAAHDMLQVKPADGGPAFLVPFVRQFVPEVDIAARRLVLDLPEGLADL